MIKYNWQANYDVALSIVSSFLFLFCFYLNYSGANIEKNNISEYFDYQNIS